ncbi:MAG TPA: hypothetical protein VFK09_10165 [Gemmatimonadales bacterium]|nr:hypothetical protein [Gemmatimonadales bacterium]
MRRATVRYHTRAGGGGAPDPMNVAVRRRLEPGQRPPLRHSVVWTAIGNGVYLASQYGILMVLAKLGSTTLVGQFSLGLAIVTPVLIFSQMQLRQVFVTDAGGATPFAAFFWARVVVGAPALLGTIAVVAALGYEREFQAVTALLGTAKLAESLSDMLYASLQRRERMDFVAGAMIFRGALGLAAVAGGLWWTRSLLGAVGALAAAWGLALVFVDLGLVRRAGREDTLAWRWNRAEMFGLMRTSAPLTMAAGLVSLSASIPRYVLEYFQGKSAVALFTVAMAPISLMGIFTGAIAQATLARAAVYLQGGQFRAFSSLGRKLAAVNALIGLALVTLLVAAGRPLVRLLFTPEYEPAVPVMIILGAGVAISGLGAFGSTVVLAGRRFHLQLANVIVALLVQVPLCILLVPRYAIFGAGWAEFGKLVVTTVFLHVVGFRAYRALRPLPPAAA